MCWESSLLWKYTPLPKCLHFYREPLRVRNLARVMYANNLTRDMYTLLTGWDLFPRAHVLNIWFLGAGAILKDCGNFKLDIAEGSGSLG